MSADAGYRVTVIALCVAAGALMFAVSQGGEAVRKQNVAALQRGESAFAYGCGYLAGLSRALPNEARPAEYGRCAEYRAIAVEHGLRSAADEEVRP
jgi:hypothetical protein